MNVRSIYPSPWISHEDLGSKKFELTVSGVGMEEIHDRTTNKKVSKPVVSFREAKKRMICNKTQLFAFAAICGSDETADWVGRRVALRAGKTHNGKATLVVEAPAVQAPAAQLDAGHGDDSGE